MNRDHNHRGLGTLKPVAGDAVRMEQVVFPAVNFNNPFRVVKFHNQLVIRDHENFPDVSIYNHDLRCFL